MNKRDFKLTIGGSTIEGKWALLIGILILIPVLCIVGLVLGLVFSLISVIIGGTFTIVGGALSIVGVVVKFVLVILKFALYFAFGAIGLAILLAIIALFLPKSLRDKLGFRTVFIHKHTKNDSQNTQTDSKPKDSTIIDVDYTEEDE